jgi:hypothetical protein
MKIALTIIHNKSKPQNEAQITALKTLLEEQSEFIDGVDDQGAIIPNAFTRWYYTIKNLNITHEVEIQQIVPFNPAVPFSFSTRQREVNGKLILEETNDYEKNLKSGDYLPSNLYELKSRVVIYCPSQDTRKDGRPFISEHPRFFNWALKRGFDNGAEISIYLQDPSALTGTKARQALQKLVNNTEFVEESWGKIGTLKLLKQIGQLKEDRSFAEAITDFKARVTQGGLKNG